MEWMILCLLLPAVLVPVVLLFGFAGCNQVFGLDPTHPATPPSAPTMLVVQILSGSSVSLSWQNTDPDTVRFQVNRAVVNGAFTTVNDQVTGQSFVDTGLTEGQTFLYVVNAISSFNLQSTDSNVVSVSLVFKTVFTATLTDNDTGLKGNCLVQTIKAHDFNDPGNPGNLANETGTFLRLSIRGSTAGLLELDKIFVSQVASPSATNPNPDLWDSAADLKLVASNVTLAAGEARTLDTIAYLLDPTRDLLVAFDVSNNLGSGSLRFAAITGPVANFRAATAQAGVPDRLPDFDSRPDQLYLIEKIEVL